MPITKINRASLRRANRQEAFKELHGVTLAEIARNAATYEALNATELPDITRDPATWNEADKPNVAQPADLGALPEP
jgi:hypothetical protein